MKNSYANKNIMNLCEDDQKAKRNVGSNCAAQLKVQIRQPIDYPVAILRNGVVHNLAERLSDRCLYSG